jgi:hypothetical protein
MWWSTSVIPATGWMRHDDEEFRGSLGYISRPHFKNKTKQKQSIYGGSHL